MDTVLGPEDIQMNKLGKNSAPMMFHSSVGSEGVTEPNTKCANSMKWGRGRRTEDGRNGKDILFGNQDKAFPER